MRRMVVFLALVCLIALPAMASADSADGKAKMSGKVARAARAAAGRVAAPYNGQCRQVKHVRIAVYIECLGRVSDLLQQLGIIFVTLPDDVVLLVFQPGLYCVVHVRIIQAKKTAPSSAVSCLSVELTQSGLRTASST